ncbi:MAG: branched-chain amino acid ABC transporter permease [Thermacetogeniaceae bacterium]
MLQRTKANKMYLMVAAAVVLYLLLKASIAFGVINPYWQRVLFYSLIVTIGALGLGLVYGFTGQFSLGHAAFVGLGAYSAGYFSKTFEAYGVLSFVGALLIGMLFAGLMGFIIGLPVLRLKSDYLGIATLGFGFIVKVGLDNANKLIPELGGATGMTGTPQMTNLEWLFFLALLVIILVRNLVFSSYGRACTSIREDETAAEMIGVNTFRTKLMAFTLGCSLAGLGGALYAHTYPYICPGDFYFLQSFDYLIIVVLGGLGSITGTVVTAIGWAFLLEVLRFVLGQQFVDFRGVIYAVILITVILVRRQGLFAGKEFSWLVPEVRRRGEECRS